MSSLLLWDEFCAGARACVRPVLILISPSTPTTVPPHHHRALYAILKKHLFVGVIDGTHSLVQHDTKLLLVRHAELWSATILVVCVCIDVCAHTRSHPPNHTHDTHKHSKELFYQLAIRRFGCMPRYARPLARLSLPPTHHVL